MYEIYFAFIKNCKSHAVLMCTRLYHKILHLLLIEVYHQLVFLQHIVTSIFLLVLRRYI